MLCAWSLPLRPRLIEGPRFQSMRLSERLGFRVGGDRHAEDSNGCSTTPSCLGKGFRRDLRSVITCHDAPGASNVVPAQVAAFQKVGKASLRSRICQGPHVPHVRSSAIRCFRPGWP